jgi:hypothetical protein
LKGKISTPILFAANAAPERRLQVLAFIFAGRYRYQKNFNFQPYFITSSIGLKAVE